MGLYRRSSLTHSMLHVAALGSGQSCLPACTKELVACCRRLPRAAGAGALALVLRVGLKRPRKPASVLSNVASPLATACMACIRIRHPSQPQYIAWPLLEELVVGRVDSPHDLSRQWIQTYGLITQLDTQRKISAGCTSKSHIFLRGNGAPAPLVA